MAESKAEAFLAGKAPSLRQGLLVVLLLCSLPRLSCWSASIGERTFTQEQEQIIQTINVGVAATSFCGSCFVAVCIIWLGKLNILHFKMVFILSIWDMVYSIAMLGNPADGSTFFGTTTILCRAQGFVLQFAGASSSAWVVAIAYQIYSLFKTTEVTEETNFLYYTAFTTLFATVTAALPLLTDTYGDAGPFCWIDNSATGNALRYVCFYGPTWLFMGAIAILFLRVKQALSEVLAGADPAHGESLARVVRKVIMYPVIMLVCWILPTANRIQNTADPDHPSFLLYAAYVLFSNLNGLANAVVYGMTAGMRGALQAGCCKCWAVDSDLEHVPLPEDLYLEPAPAPNVSMPHDVGVELGESSELGKPDRPTVKQML